jgi:hypothetical protein
MTRAKADDSYALHFGGMLHGALAELITLRTHEAAKAWIVAQETTVDTRRHVLGMLEGYTAKWGKDLPAMLCEVPFTVPIINPATGRKSKSFEQYGFYDGVALPAASPTLYEHKTHSGSSPGNMEKLFSDSQITGYVSSLRDQGLPVRSVIYDTIGKCGLRMGKKEEQDAFFDRRDQWYLDHPEKFAREEAFIGDGQILDWRKDLWLVTQGILAARRTGHWCRNTDRCFDFYRACEFVPLCQSGGSEIVKESQYCERKRRETKTQAAPAVLAF